MKRLAAVALLAACEGARPAHPEPEPVVVTPAAVASASADAGETSTPPVVAELDADRIVDTRYTMHVRIGNQVALGPSGRTWAVYLNGMHNRLHPRFTDAFLASLDALPASAPENDPKLVTRLEIVIASDGTIAELGVVRSSGVRAFDRGAVESALRARPLAAPDPSMLSTDGRAYVHWDFHRDAVIGCSTANVQPYRLVLGR